MATPKPQQLEHSEFDPEIISDCYIGPLTVLTSATPARNWQHLRDRTDQRGTAWFPRQQDNVQSILGEEVLAVCERSEDLDTQQVSTILRQPVRNSTSITDHLVCIV